MEKNRAKSDLNNFNASNDETYSASPGELSMGYGSLLTERRPLIGLITLEIIKYPQCGHVLICDFYQ
ncbi:MAG: hypothetical protein F6K08_34855 [Okeania sp. SIO1H6]|nr:hypothetical protein [Okeania sp. SIO1H6]